jgi:hypothetical protein
MAEIRPYKENYLARRRKVIFSLALFLVAAAAALAILLLRSGSGPGVYAGQVVRISGSVEDIGLVKSYREGKSISYFSAASGFKDLVYHRLQGEYAIKVIARDAAAYLQKMKRDSREMAAGGPDRADAQAPSSPPPPVNVVPGETGPVESAAAENQKTAGGQTEAEPPAEPAPGEGDPGLGYTRMREEGAREYDRAVGELAQKADEIDSLWQKHRDFCQGTITATVGNAYGREWFGIYTTINAADTPECRMMIQDMRTLAEEIDAGMEAAWEKAHRAGVYPGQMRAVQQKYLMELDRWNK